MSKRDFLLFALKRASKTVTIFGVDAFPIFESPEQAAVRIGTVDFEVEEPELNAVGAWWWLVEAEEFDVGFSTIQSPAEIFAEFEKAQLIADPALAAQPATKRLKGRL